MLLTRLHAQHVLFVDHDPCLQRPWPKTIEAMLVFDIANQLSQQLQHQTVTEAGGPLRSAGCVCKLLYLRLLVAPVMPGLPVGCWFRVTKGIVCSWFTTRSWSTWRCWQGPASKYCFIPTEDSVPQTLYCKEAAGMNHVLIRRGLRVQSRSCMALLDNNKKIHMLGMCYARFLPP